MSVWDKINFDDFTGEDKPVDPKLKKLLTKSHGQLVRDENNRVIGKKGGENSSWTKDSKNQSYAGKARAKKGGVQTLLDNSSFDSRSKGGKKQGPKNVESGHWKKCQDKALEIVTQKVKCPNCPKVGPHNVMQAWHFDKCKWIGFDFSVVHKMSQDGMSNNVIAKELGITRWNVSDILNGKF